MLDTILVGGSLIVLSWVLGYNNGYKIAKRNADHRLDMLVAIGRAENANAQARRAEHSVN